MTDESPGARAVAALEIDDVLVIESECKVSRDFNPTTPREDVAAFAHRVSVDDSVMIQTRTPAQGLQFNVVRYFFNIEIRLIRPEISVPPDPESLTDDQIQATMRLLLAVDYRSKETLNDPDAIGAFSANAQFHVWPYVREEIHAMCSRLRIPRVTLPMLKPVPMADGSGRLRAPTSIQK